MTRINFLTLANIGLITMGVVGMARADDFTAATLNGTPAPGAVAPAPVKNGTTGLYGGTSIPATAVEILNAAYYRALPLTTTTNPTTGVVTTVPYTNGPVTGGNGYNFFDTEGATPGANPAATNTKNACYGLLRFDLTSVKAKIAAHYGTNPYVLKNAYLVMTQSDAAFTYGGSVAVDYTSDDTTVTGYKPVFNAATGKTTFVATWTTASPVNALTDPFKYPDPNAVANGYTGTANFTNGPVPTPQEPVAVYAFHRGGDPSDAGFDPYAVGGTAAGTGYLDYIPLYGKLPVGLATSPATLAIPTAPTPLTADAPLTLPQGSLDLAAHVLSNSALTLVLNANDPNVAATWNGISAYFPVTVDPNTGAYTPSVPATARYAPQVVVTAASPFVGGIAALEGVKYPYAGPVTLDPITISFRTPGTKTVVGTATVTPDPIDGSFSYTIPTTLYGTYDVAIKGPKNLSVVVAGVDTTKQGLGSLNLTLPAGDANGDNVVDTSDFNILAGAFGATFDPNQPNSVTGYDPTADFNYDGTIDTSDFNLLVGEFGNSGQ